MVQGLFFLAVFSGLLSKVLASVEITRGISQQETEDIIKETGFDDTSKDHWQALFLEEGYSMLEVTKLMIARTAEDNRIEDPQTVKIGCIVSLSDNGGGVLELMRLLKEADYKDIKVAVVVENAKQRNPAIFSACVEILGRSQIPNSQVFIYRSTDSKRSGSSQKFSPMGGQYSSIDKMKAEMWDRHFLVDGLAGGRYEAESLRGVKPTSKTLKAALELMPSLAPIPKPGENSRVIVMSHVTPSGMNEDGKWVDCEPFNCQYIFTGKFPLMSIKESTTGCTHIVGRLVHTVNENLKMKCSFLEAMKRTVTELADDVRKIQEEFEKYPESPIVIVG